MIECDECGTVFRVMTDSYRCPTCGTNNYPDDNAGDGPAESHVFRNCNVCGIVLRSDDEFRMGMCERCASE